MVNKSCIRIFEDTSKHLLKCLLCYSRQSPDFKMGSTTSVAFAVVKQCPKTYVEILANPGVKFKIQKGVKGGKKG